MPTNKKQCEGYINPLLPTELTDKTPLIHTEQSESYWYCFGYQYAGIINFSFIEAVYKYCKKHNLDRIYFMARDGDIMKKVFDIMYAHDKSIKSYYLYASRRLFLVASILDMDNETLSLLTGGIHNTSYGEFIERLEIPELLEKANIYFNDLNKKLVTHKDTKLLKLFFLEYQDILLDSAALERKNLIHYLDTCHFFDNQNLLLVDIGWSASSQKYLEKILECTYHGFYFATQKNTYLHKNIHGFFFDCGKPEKHESILKLSIEVSELLFMGVHPSISKIDENAQPVYQQIPKEEHIRINIAKQIHSGTLDFIAIHKNNTENSNINRISIYTIMQSLLRHPTIEDIRHISTIPHAMGMGRSSYQPIIDDLKQTPLQYYVQRLIDGQRHNDFWHQGRIQYYMLQGKYTYPFLRKLLQAKTSFQKCRKYSLLLCYQKILAAKKKV